MDFVNLANILVKRDNLDWQLTGEIIFILLYEIRLTEKSRNELAVELLQRAIKFKRFDIAMKLWKHFAEEITANPQTVIEMLVYSFGESCEYLEFKAYFFDKLSPFIKET